MSSKESHRERSAARPRRRPERVAVEGLETRQLMTYSAFGFSLPDSITSDGSHVWVANHKANTVTELDAATGKLMRILRN